MNFSQEIISWYAISQRNLPWRNTKNPYPIWLSEILLQQTRVAQGLPYYHRFLSAYPSLLDLSNATENQIFSLWEGLGYYNRARNLLQTAKILAKNPYPHFPTTPQELKKLPGIGPYTAAAVAAFAFDYPAPVCDGNVVRVLTRFLGLDLIPSSSLGQKLLQQALSELFDPNQPALFNQAIMDFGATCCTPKQPLCHTCPLSRHCKAFALGSPESFPKKSPKKPKKDRFFAFLLLLHQNNLLVQQRPAGDIWAGLWQFPLIHCSSQTDFQRANLAGKLPGQQVHQIPLKAHLLSHQRIFSSVQIWQLHQKPIFPGQWIAPQKLQEMAMPRLLTRFLEEHSLEHWLRF